MMLAQVNLGASLFKRGVLWISVFAAVLLAACSSTPDKPAPTALVPLTPQLTVKPVWSAQVGPIGSPLSLNANAGLLGIVSQCRNRCAGLATRPQHPSLCRHWLGWSAIRRHYPI